jgi:hypothetical protein
LGSELAGFQDAAGDVVGEVPEPQGCASEVLERPDHGSLRLLERVAALAQLAVGRPAVGPAAVIACHQPQRESETGMKPDGRPNGDAGQQVRP